MTFLVADIALNMTIALIAIFFVLFPVVLHGLIGAAVAVTLGERRQNAAYARGDEDADPDTAGRQG